MIALSNQYSPYQRWSVNWLSLKQPSKCLVPTRETSTGLCLSRLILREQGLTQVSKRLRYNMKHSLTTSPSPTTLDPLQGSQPWPEVTQVPYHVHLYKYSSYAHTQRVNQPLKSNLSNLGFYIPNLRPYEGPPRYRHGSIISKHNLGSPLSSSKFRSSNFH